nr:MAG TPA: hypothetical protein [Caudoviricetes sp.]
MTFERFRELFLSESINIVSDENAKTLKFSSSKIHNDELSEFIDCYVETMDLFAFSHDTNVDCTIINENTGYQKEIKIKHNSK